MLLKLLQERSGVKTFSVDPYQIGHENEEAIASGAFWFYRKLGFAPESKELWPLLSREEHKIESQPGYRTPPATLRKLAGAAGLSSAMIIASTARSFEPVTIACPFTKRYVTLIRTRS